MQGSSDDPNAPQTLHLTSSASADHEIHLVGSPSAGDVLDFDRQGLDVVQGLDGSLRVSGRQPVFVQGIERINGVPPTVYPCVRGAGVDPCPDISIGTGITVSLTAGFIDWGADHWTVTAELRRRIGHGGDRGQGRGGRQRPLPVADRRWLTRTHGREATRSKSACATKATASRPVHRNPLSSALSSVRLPTQTATGTYRQRTSPRFFGPRIHRRTPSEESFPPLSASAISARPRVHAPARDRGARIGIMGTADTGQGDARNAKHRTQFRSRDARPHHPGALRAERLPASRVDLAAQARSGVLVRAPERRSVLGHHQARRHHRDRQAARPLPQRAAPGHLHERPAAASGRAVAPPAQHGPAGPRPLPPRHQQLVHATRHPPHGRQGRARNPRGDRRGGAEDRRRLRARRDRAHHHRRDRRDARRAAPRLGAALPLDQRDHRAAGPRVPARGDASRNARARAPRALHLLQRSVERAPRPSHRRHRQRGRQRRRSTARRCRRSSCSPTTFCSSSPATRPPATP